MPDIQALVAFAVMSLVRMSTMCATGGGMLVGMGATLALAPAKSGPV